MVGSDGFIFLGRLLERLLGVAVGGMCVWLGYPLFARVRDTAAAGKLDFPGGSVFLTNVGPGAFFALFGAAIVALSISKAVTLDSKLQTSHGAGGGLEQQVFTRHVSGLAPPVPGAAPSGELARAREQVSSARAPRSSSTGTRISRSTSRTSRRSCRPSRPRPAGRARPARRRISPPSQRPLPSNPPPVRQHHVREPAPNLRGPHVLLLPGLRHALRAARPPGSGRGPPPGPIGCAWRSP